MTWEAEQHILPERPAQTQSADAERSCEPGLGSRDLILPVIRCPTAASQWSAGCWGHSRDKATRSLRSWGTRVKGVKDVGLERWGEGQGVSGWVGGASGWAEPLGGRSLSGGLARGRGGGEDPGHKPRPSSARLSGGDISLWEFRRHSSRAPVHTCGAGRAPGAKRAAPRRHRLCRNGWDSGPRRCACW